MSLRLLLLPIVLIAALSVIIFIEKPLWQKNTAAQKEVTALKKDLEEVKGKNGSAQKTIEAYQATTGERILIMNALPEEKEGNILMAEFFEKAKKTSAFLKSIKIDEGEVLTMDILQRSVEEEDSKSKKATKSDIVASAFAPEEKGDTPYGLRVVKSTMELIGNYEQIRNFVLEVEKMNRFLNVVLLDIKKSENTETTSAEGDAPTGEIVQVSLEANAYWMKSRQEEAMSVIGPEAAKKNGKNPVSLFADDLIFKSILSGKFSSEAITLFQNSITKEVFQFNGGNSQGGIGKSNLF